MDAWTQQRQHVADAGRRLVREGLAARTWGNVSCRAEGTHIWITPSGLGYTHMGAEDIVRYDMASGEWEGKRKPSSEKMVHAAAYARFAQALAMGFSSGLTLEESVDLAALLLKDVPAAVKRCEKCRELLDSGETLAHALGETELMSTASCRLLTLGMRGGAGDSVMEEIARRMQEEARLELESKVAKIEPALVLVTSVLVGVILLSVMLPLMNIMTAIG